MTQDYDCRLDGEAIILVRKNGIAFPQHVALVDIDPLPGTFCVVEQLFVESYEF